MKFKGSTILKLYTMKSTKNTKHKKTEVKVNTKFPEFVIKRDIIKNWENKADITRTITGINPSIKLPSIDFAPIPSNLPNSENGGITFLGRYNSLLTAAA